jgi:hypothetical protein
MKSAKASDEIKRFEVVLSSLVLEITKITNEFPITEALPNNTLRPIKMMLETPTRFAEH